MLDRNSILTLAPLKDLFEILKGVSRSFYLSIRVLPPKIRWPIALAYLLARAADTLADAPALPVAERKTALATLRNALQEPTRIEPETFTNWNARFENHPHEQERFLIYNTQQCLQLYSQLPTSTRQAVQKVLMTLTEGMLEDLQTFSVTLPDPVQLEKETDTDRYTYLVAGCVGAFWTEILTHAFQFKWNLEAMSKVGIEFGKGLQWVNILRDIPGDYRNQRIYLSCDVFSRFELTKSDLKDAIEGKSLSLAKSELFKRMMAYFFSNAEPKLLAGLDYVRALPWHAIRLRLAVIWPLWIGLRTFHLLENAEVFFVSSKVSRLTVYKLMAVSLLFCMHSGLLAWYTSRLYASARTNNPRT